MKMKSFKRVLSLALATAMVLTACGQKPAANTSESTPVETPAVNTSESTPTEAASEVEEVKEIASVTLYPKDGAIFSGETTGWRGDFLAENGLEMEIWAWSEDKTTAMLVSGDFPDMMYLGNGATSKDVLTTLIETDKIINYDDYKEYLPHVFGDQVANEFIAENLDLIREDMSAGTGGLYVLPFNTGVQSSYYAKSNPFGQRAVKLKWDVYEAIGAPEVTDVWSLIDIVEDMLEYQPVDADGNKMYGTALHSGKDGSYFGSFNIWYKWFGGDVGWNYNCAEVNYLTGGLKYIFDDDSLFKLGLDWYHEMYSRGLLDPDSISAPAADQEEKVWSSRVMIPSGTAAGFVPVYYEVFPEGAIPYQNAASERMSSPEWSIVIFKDSENIEACLKFVDMMADPFACLQYEYGPEGEIWQLDGNVLSITDEALKYYEANGNFEGFPMSDGTEYFALGLSKLVGSGTLIPGYVDINGDPICWTISVWPEVQDINNNNPNWEAWKKTMGADSVWEYVEKNNVDAIINTPYDDVAVDLSDQEMQLKMAAVKDAYVSLCWQMIYAESDEEYNALWEKMKKDCEALGAKEVFEYCYTSYEPYVAGLQSK